jgi:hypothetical protein
LPNKEVLQINPFNKKSISKNENLFVKNGGRGIPIEGGKLRKIESDPYFNLKN